MGATAVLAIRIISDHKDGQKGMEETATTAGRLQSAMGSLAIPAAVVGGALIKMGKDSFDAANALQQSTGAVTSVFGDAAGQVQQFADASATAVGLSKNQYQELASVVGSQLGNMGVAQDQVVGKTNDLITKGADLAATFGGTTSDAVSALSALMRGETDPIERYGVSIKQSDINARLAQEGLSGLTGEQLKAAETNAKLTLLQEQTAAATGQFTRETDSAAGAQQIATAQWENAQATLGQSLLPVLTQGAQILGSFAGWVSENSEVVGALIVVLGSAAAAVGLLNFVLAANPISIVVLAIAGLIAGLVLAYNNVGWFRDGVDTMGRVAGDVFTNIGNFIGDVINGIARMIGWIQDAVGWFQSLFGAKSDAASVSAGGSSGGFGLMGAGPGPGDGQGGHGAPPPPAFGMMGASSLMSAPALPGGGGALSASFNGFGSVTNIKIEVNGALDPVKVGEQIDGILRKTQRRNGHLTNGANLWA